MAYCTEQDILDRFEDQEIIELTNDTPGATQVGNTVISKAISDAEAEINGYCERWYTIPLSPVPQLVTKLCIDIAIYNIYSRRTQMVIPEAVSERYKNAVRMLQSIGKQNILLGADTTNPVKASALGVFQANDRVFTKDNLKGF